MDGKFIINPGNFLMFDLALDVVRQISIRIPALKQDKSYIYLGLYVSARGTEPRVLFKQTTQLKNLSKAP